MRDGARDGHAEAVPIDLRTEVEIAAGVVGEFAGEELILLDTARGMYYALDAVGARMWVALRDAQCLHRAAERLLGEFDVSRDRLESDLVGLVRQLHAHGLVEVRRPGR